MKRTASSLPLTVDAALGERAEDRLAQAALRPVVLDGQNVAACLLGRGDERLRVERLDRVQVDDARLDPCRGQRVGRGERLEAT